MRRRPVVAALLVIVGGVCFQVRGNTDHALTDSMSAGYPNRTTTEGKSLAGPITAAPRAGKTADSPLLVSQLHQAKQHRVMLSWYPSLPTTLEGKDLISGYNVYRRRERGTMYTKYTRINSDLVTDTTYVDATVRSGQFYDYQTTAVNYQGIESVPSNHIRVEIPFP